jgi:hypothetical protein
MSHWKYSAKIEAHMENNVLHIDRVVIEAPETPAPIEECPKRAAAKAPVLTQEQRKTLDWALANLREVPDVNVYRTAYEKFILGRNNLANLIEILATPQNGGSK